MARNLKPVAGVLAELKMSDSPPNGNEDATVELRVADVLNAWLDRRAAGTAETIETLQAAHPDIAGPLNACLESIEWLDVTGLATDSPSATTEPETSATEKPTSTPSEKNFPSIPDFQIFDELGRGGMGIVYQAEQLSLRRTVALKILPQTTVDPQATARFRREAETAAALHHTHIVPIYAVGQAGGVHWFAMQKIEGHPLDHLMQKHADGVDTDEVARIGIEAAEALAYAHRSGVIHRDIKPGNLLIEPDGHVWLADFGLARRDIDPVATLSGAMLGTPRYMSPEQVFCTPGQPADHRSDIYSLGATLYEIATGQALFDAPTPLDVLQQIRWADPPRPRTIRPGMPRDLEIVLQKCLAKSPADRYQNAEDLAADLRAVREGRTISARGVPFVSTVFRRAAQHRPRIKLAASMVLATAAIIMIGWTILFHHRQSRLGVVKTTATDGPFVASVFPIDVNGTVDREPIASTTVPMQSPLDFPAGDYVMRLAGHGRFSENTHFTLQSGQVRSLHYVDRRPAPKEVELTGRWTRYLRGTNGEHYLATISDQTFAIYSRDAEVVLDVPCQSIAENSGASFDYQVGQPWSGIRGVIEPNKASPCRVMQDAIDLNSDGRDDFVISARKSPVIAAIDQDGKTLWSINIQPKLTKGFPAAPKIRRDGSPLELPSIFQIVPIDDLDDDGTRDILVNLSRINPGFGIEPFLVSLSGRSGATIATAALPPILKSKPRTNWPLEGKLLYRSKNSHGDRLPSLLMQIGSAGLRRTGFVPPYRLIWSDTLTSVLPVTPPVRVVRFKERDVAVTTLEDSLQTYDLATGELVTTNKVTFPIDSSPYPVTLANREPAFLVFSTLSQHGNPIRRRVAMIVLGESEPRWIRNLELRTELYSGRREKSDLPFLVDLDGDGSDELLLPIRDSLGNRAPGKLTCLDAASGEPKWESPVTISACELLPERVKPVGDLNGDGIVDLLVASLVGRETGDQHWAMNIEAKQFWIYLDLISGIDGKRLFWRRAEIPAFDTIESAFDIDSIRYERTSSGARVTASLVFGSTEESRLDSMSVQLDLSGNSPLRIANGITQLCPDDRTSSGGFFRRRPGPDDYYKDVAYWIDDAPPTSYRIGSNRMFESWQSPNGRACLLIEGQSHREFVAVDAKDGRAIWTFPHGYGSPTAVAVHSIDGPTRHLIIQIGRHLGGRPHVVDAETGRVRSEIDGTIGDVLAAYEPSGDTDEIVILATSTVRGFQASAGTTRLVLLKIDPRSGKIIWQQPFFRHLPSDVMKRSVCAHLIVDCDRDGIRDLIVPDDGANSDLSVSAYSGKDGQRLWSHDLRLPGERWSHEGAWPPMTLVGPPDQRHVVLMDTLRSDSFAVKMLSTRHGQLINEVDLNANVSLSRASNYLYGIGRLGLINESTTEEWSSVAVTYASRPARSSQTMKAWSRLETSAGGLGPPVLLDQNGFSIPPWIPVDADGDGQSDFLKVDGSSIRCTAKDGSLISEATLAGGFRFDRVHHRDGIPSMAGVYLRKSEQYALIDLSSGKEVFRDPIPGSEHVVDRHNPQPTPMVLASNDGLRLLRTTRHGFRFASLSPKPDSGPLLIRERTDPRNVTRLPTSPLWGGQTLLSLFGPLLSAMSLTVFALLIPLGYVYKLIRDRRWTLGYLMVAPMVAVLALLAWQQLLQPVELSMNPSANEPWPVVLLGGCISCAAITFLIRAFTRRRFLGLAIAMAIASGFTALMIGMPILTASISDSQVIYRWGVADAVAMMLMMSMNVLMFAFAITCGWSLFQRLFYATAGRGSRIAHGGHVTK